MTEKLSEYLYNSGDWKPAHEKYSSILDTLENLFREAIDIKEGDPAEQVEDEVIVLWYVYFVPMVVLHNALNPMEATLSLQAGSPSLGERKLIALLKNQWQDMGCDCFMCRICTELQKNNAFHAVREELVKVAIIPKDNPLTYDRLRLT